MVRPIGIIDSGLGGLAVAAAVWQYLPLQSTIYLADHAYFPYGNKPTPVINRRLITLLNFLLSQNCQLVVIACNTITSTSINWLRSLYPFPFIGTEPAIKPVLEANLKESIVVLTTPATAKSPSYKRLVSQYDLKGQVVTVPCPKLAEQIETYALRLNKLKTLIKRQLDQITTTYTALVLGCTHYLLVKDLIKSLVPPSVIVIDPSEAIAKQTVAVLPETAVLSSATKPGWVFYSTASKNQLPRLSRSASQFLKQRIIFSSCRL